MLDVDKFVNSIMGVDPKAEVTVRRNNIVSWITSAIERDRKERIVDITCPHCMAPYEAKEILLDPLSAMLERLFPISEAVVFEKFYDVKSKAYFCKVTLIKDNKDYKIGRADTPLAAVDVALEETES